MFQRLERATLADQPLIVIRTNNETPGYAELQAKLLALSSNSSQILAGNSSHMIIVDEPQIIVASIRKVVDSIRSGRYRCRRDGSFAIFPDIAALF